MDKSTKSLYEFGPFQVDMAERLLFNDGQIVSLPPKVFDILLVLVQKRGRVLRKEELIEEVWPDTFVEEGNLARNISTLRKILGDGPEGRQYIETIPRRGYRFVATVKEISDGSVVARETSRITTQQEDETCGRGQIEYEKPAVDTDQPAEGEKQMLQSADRDADAHLLPTTSAQLVVAAGTKMRKRVVLFVTGLAIAAAIAGSFSLGKRAGKTEPPFFSRLTFRNGVVGGARFAPGGQMIIYDAAWEGRPSEIFATQPGSAESRPLELPDSRFFAISSAGELAVALNPTRDFISRGTLARMSLTGGAPRPVITDVQDADWSPSGRDLAVVRYEAGICRIEFPVGHVLYEIAEQGWISDVRVSPKGNLIAFLDHPAMRYDDRGSVAVIDLAGNKKALSKDYTSAFGLAWSPAGDEVWFTAAEDDTNCALRGVDLSGRERLIARVTGRLRLLDISSDGRVLISQDNGRIGMVIFTADDSRERELSWLDGSWLRDISADARTVLFDEEGTGGKTTAGVYIRKTDGSPAIRLGEGHAISLSPDGKWALSRLRFTSPPQLRLLPTGVGDTKSIRVGEINFFEAGTWFPDSKRILLMGGEPGRAARCWIYNIDSEQLRSVTPEGVTSRVISADGKYILARQSANNFARFPVEGGQPQPVRGLQAEDRLIRWGAGGALYISQDDMSRKIYRVDQESGQRELWKQVTPSDPTGLLFVSLPVMTSDGKAYGYTYFRVLSNLYLLEGVN
jgi:eukaryotic-like serine/threonine-protein kinase